MKKIIKKNCTYWKAEWRQRLPWTKFLGPLPFRFVPNTISTKIYIHIFFYVVDGKCIYIALWTSSSILSILPLYIYINYISKREKTKRKLENKPMKIKNKRIQIIWYNFFFINSTSWGFRRSDFEKCEI